MTSFSISPLFTRPCVLSKSFRSISRRVLCRCNSRRRTSRKRALSDVAVEVSFMQSSLLRLVDERDQLRNNLLRRFFHQPMAFAFDDNSFDVRVYEPCLLDQKLS